MADEISGSTPDLGAILGELLSNKEVMSQISKIASQSTDSEENESQNDAVTDAPPISFDSSAMQRLPEVINVIKPLLSSKPESKQAALCDKRIGLLIALKPYMSQKRCETIDYIIRISKLSETLKGLKL